MPTTVRLALAAALAAQTLAVTPVTGGTTNLYPKTNATQYLYPADISSYGPWRAENISSWEGTGGIELAGPTVLTATGSSNSTNARRVSVATLYLDFTGTSIAVEGYIAGEAEMQINAGLVNVSATTTKDNTIFPEQFLDWGKHTVRVDLYGGTMGVLRVRLGMPVETRVEGDHPNDVTRDLARTDQMAVTDGNANTFFEVEGEWSVGEVAVNTTYPLLLGADNSTLHATLPPQTSYAILVGASSPDFGNYTLRITPPPPMVNQIRNPLVGPSPSVYNESVGHVERGTAQGPNALVQMWTASLEPDKNYTVQVEKVEGKVGVYALYTWSADGRNDSASTSASVLGSASTTPSGLSNSGSRVAGVNVGALFGPVCCYALLVDYASYSWRM